MGFEVFAEPARNQFRAHFAEQTIKLVVCPQYTTFELVDYDRVSQPWEHEVDGNEQLEPNCDIHSQFSRINV